MEEIKSFLVSVMVISVITGIIKLISPDSKNEALKKQISLAGAIAVSMVIASSFIKLINNDNISVDIKYSVSEPENMAAGAANEVIQSTAEIITNEVKAMIAEKFGLQDFRVDVKINSEDTSNLKIEEVVIEGEGELSQIKEYVSEMLGCSKNNVKIEGEASE